jgi:MFS family permease
MALGPPQGFENELSGDVGVLIYVLLLLIGLLIAFAGRAVWRHLMSFIGAIIGGLLGFVIGTAVGGILVGLFVSMLCAVVGSFVFIFLAEFGLGVVAGLFTYFVVVGVLENEIVALIAAAMALVLTIIFIDHALSIVTAVIGGLLVGLAILWLDWLDMTMVVLAMFAVIIFGAAIQLTAIKDRDEEERRRAVGQGAVAATPAAPPMTGRACPTCGGPLEYIPEYNRYYCYRCQRYE